jgi:hypothetical protein
MKEGQQKIRYPPIVLFQREADQCFYCILYRLDNTIILLCLYVQFCIYLFILTPVFISPHNYLKHGSGEGVGVCPDSVDFSAPMPGNTSSALLFFSFYAKLSHSTCDIVVL